VAGYLQMDSLSPELLTVSYSKLLVPCTALEMGEQHSNFLTGIAFTQHSSYLLEIASNKDYDKAQQDASKRKKFSRSIANEFGLLTFSNKLICVAQLLQQMFATSIAARKYSHDFIFYFS